MIPPIEKGQRTEPLYILIVKYFDEKLCFTGIIKIHLESIKAC